jgi:hypothetical protein
MLALATFIVCPRVFKISAPAVPMYLKNTNGPVHFYLFFPGTNYLINTFDPGTISTSGRVVLRTLYCLSILSSPSSSFARIWGSITSHQSFYSAISLACSSLVASLMHPSPPSDTPNASGRLCTSYLKATHAGGYPSLVGRNLSPAKTPGNSSVQGSPGFIFAVFLSPDLITPLYLSTRPFAWGCEVKIVSYLIPRCSQ